MPTYQIMVTGVASIMKEAISEEEALNKVTKEDLQAIDWDSIECDYAQKVED